jgi:F-type H+-transporting ATPase subunit gamma
VPSLRQLRRRIRSVQNTAKVTRAMQMVAAVKMRRAQEAALAGRPYAEKLRELLSHLEAMPREDTEQVHPLLQRREVRKIEVVHITPDRGLCGGLPSNINRQTNAFIRDAGVPVSVVAVGRKGRDYMVRVGEDVSAVFTGIPDAPRLFDTTAISRVVIDHFTNGDCDAVYVSYAQFVNTVVQQPMVRQLLPVEPAELDPGTAVGYIYEPNPVEVLAEVLPRYLEVEVYHAIQEAMASEQSARMVAMRNATDSANEMVSDLTLLMNKVRQENITTELLDIVGGMAE